MTTLTIRVKNAASNKPRWVSRARQIARRARNHRPHALAYVELYDARRSVLTALVAVHYRCVGFKRGKVLYLRRRGPWTVASRVHKWSLGNGKHAIAVRLRHRTTRRYVVVVVAHLSWQHGFASRRREEARRLARLVEGTFPETPVLAVGDWNDSRKPTATRPQDSTGMVLAGYGYRDLETDVPIHRRKNRRFNSAHGLTGRAPENGIHLDRAFGTPAVTATSWGLATHREPYDSDHWSLDLTVQINRKAAA